MRRAKEHLREIRTTLKNSFRVFVPENIFWNLDFVHSFCQSGLSESLGSGVAKSPSDAQDDRQAGRRKMELDSNGARSIIGDVWPILI